MSLPSARAIAFNRRLRFDWLREGLRLRAEGVDGGEWVGRMEQIVRLDTAGRDSIQKSMRYLRHIWIERDAQRNDLRTEAMRLYSRESDPAKDRILCWGMATATYPFLIEVAACAGRMLRVQPEIKLEQLLRKLTETFGEKETVRRSGRYSLGLIEDFGFITRPGKPGFYKAAPILNVTNEALASWYLRAWFQSADISDSMDRIALAGHPSLFPFDAKQMTDAALQSGVLVLERLSFSQDAVRLKPAVHNSPPTLKTVG